MVSLATPMGAPLLSCLGPVGVWGRTFSRLEKAQTLPEMQAALLGPGREVPVNAANTTSLSRELSVRAQVLSQATTYRT